MILNFKVKTYIDHNFIRIPELHKLLKNLRNHKILAEEMKSTIIVLQQRLEELYPFVEKVKDDLPPILLLEFSSFLQEFRKTTSTIDIEEQYRIQIHEDHPPSIEMTYQIHH